MIDNPLSRREFLKLSSVSLLGLAARTALPPIVPDLPPGCLVAPDPEVLSATQRQRLKEAAQTFIAPDIESARQVALQIDFIEGRNEDASTMCGPLAIAILQAAGLLGPWAELHDFWLLNPNINQRLLADTFPFDQYYWYEYDSPISQVDFNLFPLVSGDLVYLHAGPGDTFEHVLVVNRVDDHQRAYAVSNYFTSSGTIIEERLLYDPAQPDSGQFAAFNDRSIRNTLGNTGSGGFRVWRVKDSRHLEFPDDTAARTLQVGLDELLLASPAEWFGAIRKVGGPNLYLFNPHEAFHPASTIKVPIAMAFYSRLETDQIEDWENYIADHGVQGRTYAQLLESMIVNSEEEATQILVEFLGNGFLIDTWDTWGLQATQADPRRSSATEITHTLEQLYRGKWISEDSRAHLLRLMSTYTQNDDVRLGLLRPQLPSEATIYNKRGSLVDWPRVVGDSGIIELTSQALIFSLHGVGKNAAGYEELEATLTEAILLLGDYLRTIA